jgi:hypothetical protein
MKKKEALYVLVGAFLAVVPPRAFAALYVEQPARAQESVEDMLADFVADFRSDPFADNPITFGIRVKDAERPDWHVFAGGREDGEAEAIVELAEGLPPDPAPYYVTDLATLTAIHAGELASLTAMGKAFSTDFAPLDIEIMDGFRSTLEFGNQLTRLNFHFWTRGLPELVRFGEGATTRELHGGNAILLYYQSGFRSGWFKIEAGQHVNESEAMQTNPFPSMIIGTKGGIHCRIGGKEMELTENVAIWIGPGVTHEFWVEEGEEPGEGILLMFGEGA